MFRPRFARNFLALQTEGAGNTGCALHPRSRVQTCTKKHAHEHTGSAEAIRHSLRNGFTAYSALSPVTGLSCHRRLRKLPFANLTPASGRQDHTTSPSAYTPFVKGASASTASRPAAVTIACRPSVGRDSETYSSDLGFGKTEIFLQTGLDTDVAGQPAGQISGVVRREL